MAKQMQKDVIEHAREDLGIKDDPSKALSVAEPPKQSLWESMKDHFIDRVVPEVGQMLDHKIAQGAAELSQALNSQSNAYVPYGTGQKPLEVEGPGTSWADHVRDASQRAGQQQNEMER